MGFYILKKYSDSDIDHASYAVSKNFICMKFFGSTFLPRKVERILGVPRVLRVPLQT